MLVESEALQNELSAAMASFPCRLVIDLRDCRNVETSIKKVDRRKPDVVFVEMRGSFNPGSVVAKVKALDEPPFVVAMHASPNVDLVMAAMRAGADEFLSEPIGDNFTTVIQRAQSAAAHRCEGKVLGFVSAKGGCGATTVACHAAVEIAAGSAETGKRALLMDLDLDAGLTRFIMKAKAEFSVVDAVKNLDRLDQDFWSRLVSSPVPGLDVLGAPLTQRGGEALDWNEVHHVINFARRNYEWTILDLGKGFGRLPASILAEPDQMMLVSTPEIGALWASQRAQRLLEERGYAMERLRVVLNRFPRESPMSVADLERITGLRIFSSLPEDYKALVECYSFGRLLPKGNRLAGAVQGLANQLTGRPAPPARPSFLSGLINWRAWLLRLANAPREAPRPEIPRSLPAPAPMPMPIRMPEGTTALTAARR
jgi:pilus assembly protein CpaE